MQNEWHDPAFAHDRRRIEPAALPAQDVHRRHVRRPELTMEACVSLHLGPAVRFVDFRAGQLRQAR
jgi:hypothetical protein